MQALLNNGDEVLIPAPDYPLWTAATSISGGVPVHYLCNEDDAWQLVPEDVLRIPEEMDIARDPTDQDLLGVMRSHVT